MVAKESDSCFQLEIIAFDRFSHLDLGKLTMHDAYDTSQRLYCMQLKLKVYDSKENNQKNRQKKNIRSWTLRAHAHVLQHRWNACSGIHLQSNEPHLYLQPPHLRSQKLYHLIMWSCTCNSIRHIYNGINLPITPQEWQVNARKNLFLFSYTRRVYNNGARQQSLGLHLCRHYSRSKIFCNFIFSGNHVSYIAHCELRATTMMIRMFIQRQQQQQQKMKWNNIILRNVLRSFRVCKQYEYHFFALEMNLAAGEGA